MNHPIRPGSRAHTSTRFDSGSTLPKKKKKEKKEKEKKNEETPYWDSTKETDMHKGNRRQQNIQKPKENVLSVRCNAPLLLLLLRLLRMNGPLSLSLSRRAAQFQGRATQIRFLPRSLFLSLSLSLQSLGRPLPPRSSL
jgi:hypothetical protein